MPVHRIVTVFEVEPGVRFRPDARARIVKGARVEMFPSDELGMIPAIVVGEEGPGPRCYRRPGVLPVVALPPAVEARLRAGEEVRIMAARIRETPWHRHWATLIWADPEEVDSKDVIVVLRTPIGGVLEDRGYRWFGYNIHYHCRAPHTPIPFPVLAEGRIALGEDASQGSGEQLVVLLPNIESINIHIAGDRFGEAHDYVLVNYGGEVDLAVRYSWW